MSATEARRTQRRKRRCPNFMFHAPDRRSVRIIKVSLLLPVYQMPFLPLFLWTSTQNFKILYNVLILYIIFLNK